MTARISASRKRGPLPVDPADYTTKAYVDTKVGDAAKFGDIIATYTEGNWRTLDFTKPGNYRVRTGNGTTGVSNGPSTSVVWFNVTVLHHGGAADATAADTTVWIATQVASGNIMSMLRYGTTWGTWTQINATFSAMPVSEATTGTATTSRVMRADYFKAAVQWFLTGDQTKPATAIGQALNLAADKAAARTVIDAVATTDPRLSDARAPLAHNHNLTDLNGSSLLGRQMLAVADAPGGRFLINAEEADNPTTAYVWHDVLTFGDKLKFPTYEIATDPVTWVPVTDQAQIDTYHSLFIGKEGLAVSVVPTASTQVGWRATWSNGVAWSMIDRMLMGFAHVAAGQNKTILVESGTDGVTWTERFRTEGNLSNSATYGFKVTPPGGDTWLRLSLIGTNPDVAIRVAGIRALSKRWGDQGGGYEFTVPYDWDINKKLILNRLRLRYDNDGTVAPNGGVLTTINNFGDIGFNVPQAGNIPDTIVKRNAVGQIAVGDPTSDGHAVTKKYVDDKLASTGSNVPLTAEYTAQAGIAGSGAPALTGAVNGTNKVFVTPLPYVAGVLQVYVNGVLQVLGEAIVQTTPTSGTFTFVTAPKTGDQIYVIYGQTASGAQITAAMKGFVNHGADANVIRPVGFQSIEWSGSVAPANATAADTWVNTA